jgi:hypothetical protein
MRGVHMLWIVACLPTTTESQLTRIIYFTSGQASGVQLRRGGEAVGSVTKPGNVVAAGKEDFNISGRLA